MTSRIPCSVPFCRRTACAEKFKCEEIICGKHWRLASQTLRRARGGHLMDTIPEGFALVPIEPTPEMCLAALKALGMEAAVYRQMAESLLASIGTPHEPGIVFELRAAIAVGSGRVSLDEVKRGFKRPAEHKAAYP